MAKIIQIIIKIGKIFVNIIDEILYIKFKLKTQFIRGEIKKDKPYKRGRMDQLRDLVE